MYVHRSGLVELGGGAKFRNYLQACAIASSIWSAVSCSTYKILHCCSRPQCVATSKHVCVLGSGGRYLFLGGRMTGFLVFPSPIMFAVSLFPLFPALFPRFSPFPK